MNDEQRELEAWLEADGNRMSDPSNLGDSDEQRQKFLANRLWRAYTAGMDAGKRIAVQRIARRQATQLERQVFLGSD